MSMKWIGLTGGIATGKSTVARLLREMGYPVVDADGLARKLTEKGSDSLIEIRKYFGDKVFLEDGGLDRRQLGRIVFSDPKLKNTLEGILHPKIQELKTLAKVSLEGEGAGLAFYEVPLLFEKDLQGDFDAAIVVATSLEQQKERLRKRDQLSDEEISQRIGNQMPLEDKIKKADYVIFNNGSLSDLKQSLVQVLKDIK